jgi:hypothetical protein
LPQSGQARTDWIDQSRLDRSADGNGLQVLGGRHCAKSSASSSHAVVAEDPGKQNAFLPSRPDNRHPRAAFADPLLYQCLPLARIQTPSIGSIAYVDTAFADP